MNNVKRWIRALRSGKYKRGEGYLCNGTRYCCLGVACELYQKSVGDLNVTINKAGIKSYNRNSTVLPKKVQSWLGITSDVGAYVITTDGITFPNSLVNLNDSYHKSFSQIADIIESNPDGLFRSKKKVG